MDAPLTAGLGAGLTTGLVAGLAAGLGVFVLQTYWLLCVQKAINAVEGDPQGQANARLSGLNRLWVALGGCVWLLTLGSVALELR